MVNARILHINNMHDAKEEIRKIGVDAASIKWLAHKAVYITIKIEGVSPFAANIIKQEMLGKGGDAAVNRGVPSFEIEKSDVLVMGNYKQYCGLIYKLNMQSGILKEVAQKLQKMIEMIELGNPEYFECGKYKLPMGEKTYVMGILDIISDKSFDGISDSNIDAIVNKAKEMVKYGADIIDIGTNKKEGNAPKESIIEEIIRILPVIQRLSKELEVPIAVDTSEAVVADKVLAAGANIINDAQGLQYDNKLAETVARYGAGIVMIHNSELDGSSKEIMGDVVTFLRNSIEIAEKAGIPKESMIIDPGIGFGKSLEDNLEIMRRLRELTTLNLPILIGTSRKSLIGNVLDVPVNERLEGTAATVTLGISNGADIIRVHDVREMVRVARMTDAMVRI